MGVIRIVGVWRQFHAADVTRLAGARLRLREARNRALCVERQVALHEFGWLPGTERAGLQRDGLYLVRPDGYIGLAAHAQSSASLAAYLDSNAIR
jgi:hypothetical protein